MTETTGGIYAIDMGRTDTAYVGSIGEHLPQRWQ